ncbi:MAG: hypothetical protein COV74_03760 [Candidatus Omnitrophica bacterium CG11_big_fil_rev_8_21_14_0_20_45_26]|uniref:Uncharacterized protein n=1 Tax=Candidatus Abzuiibacterium crystallinum TaxID=1974748 RepID=A0A2H0LSP6_9BACT|nr:MAG: hypothetical protein COV74_03760 [Candidatus Omnitrophica bacterium CG11_big_fil_rev_8_21_14_0_20_45_26]PIW64377.1 MAG: hypothetical protein COW12_06375 [Candidatus Omnitrophica bacterium CG12_big_fil_rev_8_21_14_0_65_45_16]
MATPAMAGSHFDSWVDSGSYAKKAPGMLFRGVTEVISVPFDIVLGPVTYVHEEPMGPVSGLFYGIRDGVDRVVRIGSDVVGALIPGYTGMGNYKPCPLKELFTK